MRDGALKYHVLGASVPKASVPLGKAITPLAGGIFKIDAVGAGMVVTDGRNRKANITSTDVMASNGLIHVIDKVLLPPDKNIVQTAQALPQFSILVEAVMAANLQGALSAAGPLTVFAPTNDAFAALLTELGMTKAQLLANTPLLTKVLTVAGKVMAKDVKAGKVKTVQGSELTLSTTGGVMVDGAKVIAADIVADNGVIHVIDSVVLPK